MIKVTPSLLSTDSSSQSAGNKEITAARCNLNLQTNLGTFDEPSERPSEKPSGDVNRRLKKHWGTIWRPSQKPSSVPFLSQVQQTHWRPQFASNKLHSDQAAVWRWERRQSWTSPSVVSCEQLKSIKQKSSGTNCVKMCSVGHVALIHLDLLSQVLQTDSMKSGTCWARKKRKGQKRSEGRQFDWLNPNSKPTNLFTNSFTDHTDAERRTFQAYLTDCN